MPYKNNSLIKSIIYFSIFYLIYVFCTLLFLKVGSFWFLVEQFNISDFPQWFNTNFKTASFFNKVFFTFSTLLVLISNLYLTFKLKKKTLEAYNTYFLQKVMNDRTLIISIIFILNIIFLISFIKNFNEWHISALIVFTIIFYLSLITKIITLKLFQIIYLTSLGLTLRLIYYSLTSTYDLQGDSLARVSQVYDWAIHGGFPGGLSWLPMYHVFVYSIGEILNVPFEVSGRLFSLISSIILIPVLYNFNEKLFNKKTAFITVLFYCLNPFLIRYSTVQLTTIPFVLFIVYGIYLAYIYFEEKGYITFLSSVVLLNIACLLRFEAWIIIPLFSFIFFFKCYKTKQIFLWSVLSLFPAIIIAIFSYKTTGDFFWGITDSDVQVRQDLAHLTPIDSLKTMFSWPWIPIYFIPIIIIGLLDSIKSNKNRFLALSLIILSSYYFFKTIDQTLMPFWRYYSFLIITIIPFMFYWLQKQINFKYLIILFFSFYSIKSSIDVEAVYEISRPPPKGLFESAIYFRTQHLNNPSSKIIFSKVQLHPHDFWRIYSNLENDIYLEKFERTFSNFTLLKTNKEFTTENIANKIIKENFNFVLFQKGYEINSVFERADIQYYLSQKKMDTLVFKDFTLIEIN